MAQSNIPIRDVSFSKLESAIFHLIRGVIGKRPSCNDKESAILSGHIHALLSLLPEFHGYMRRRGKFGTEERSDPDHENPIQIILEQFERHPFGDQVQRQEFVESLHKIKNEYDVIVHTGNENPPASTSMSLEQNDGDDHIADREDIPVDHEAVKEKSEDTLNDILVDREEIKEKSEDIFMDSEDSLGMDEVIGVDNKERHVGVKQADAPVTTFTISSQIQSKHGPVISLFKPNEKKKKVKVHQNETVYIRREEKPRRSSKDSNMLPNSGLIKVKVGNMMYETIDGETDH